MKKKRKKTLRASHRKRPLAALMNPIVREQLESLRTDWRELSHFQRGDGLIQLLSAGCTKRGLADDLEVDDGTIRRAIKIAGLREPQRQAIDDGASPKRFLEVARARMLIDDMEMRLVLELKDGTPSSDLRDILLWFVLRERLVILSAGYVEPFIREVHGEFPGKAFRGYSIRHIKLSRPLDPAYPLGNAIKMARPELDPDADEDPRETAIQCLINLIALLGPPPVVRDAAIEKLKTSLLGLLFGGVDMQRLANEHTPTSLAAVLRDWPTEKPLYHRRHRLLP